MTKRRILIAVRLGFGLFVLAAIVVQAMSLIDAGVFRPENYLSYFTNLSNIFAGFVFIISSAYLLQKRQPSKGDDIVRGASVLYMAITGVVYSLLLRGVEVSLQLAWVNSLLHYIMPIVVVADWLYQPQRSKLQLRQIWLWLIFPAAYLAYSLIRGAMVHWYPYPFLDPVKADGYIGVALYCAGILALFFAAGGFLMLLGNRLKRNVT